jgi:CheY-like chemotaxis protein
MRRSAPPCERVLIVEDDLDTLYTLVEVLQLEGVEVTHAARSLAEAERALVTGFRPSVVLLDLNLNPERGEDLLDRLRADPTYANVRVIAFSGDRSGLLRVRGAVDAVLLKPADPAGVLKVLYDVCAQPSAFDRNRTQGAHHRFNQPSSGSPSDR